MAVVVVLSLLTYGIARRASLEAYQATQVGIAKQQVLNLLHYDAFYGSLPPAVTVDRDGRPMHSWRTLAAAIYFRTERRLHFPYDFDEPWDSRSNLDSIRRYRNPFHVRGESRDHSNTTQVVAIVGPNTAFPGTDVRRLADLPKNTVLLAILDESDILWTEPRDVTVDEFVDIFERWRQRRQSWWQFVVPIGEGPGVVFADSSARRLTTEMTAGEVRELCEVPSD